MFDEAKQLEQRAGDVWAYIDMWDYGHSSLLQFEERCCHRVRKEAVKLFEEMVLLSRFKYASASSAHSFFVWKSTAFDSLGREHPKPSGSRIVAMTSGSFIRLTRYRL
jgi:hypothetical protein